MQNKLKKMLGMKRADIKRMKKSNNFTLLELLIVVAILAIIAGGIVGSYTNIEENAAQAQAARDIAAVDQAIQIHSAFEAGIPDNVDSLLANVVTASATSTIDADGDFLVSDFSDLGAFRVGAAIDNRSETSYIDSTNGAAVTDNLLDSTDDGSGLASKFEPGFLTARQVENLQLAGITKVRYIDAELDDNDSNTTGVIPNFGGPALTPTEDESLIHNIDIAANYFDAPRGDNKGRGRGFAVNVSGDAATIAGNVEFAIWSNQTTGNNATGTATDGSGTAPTAKYNNTKVGANADAVLVCFGLGPNCTLVGKDAKFGLSSGMPYYANVKKNEYNNYVMLVDVQQRPARVVAVIDTKGDFRGEEFAEYLDQKL